MTDYSKSLIDFIDAAANDYAHYKRCYPDKYFMLCQTEIDEWLKQLRAGIMVQPSKIRDTGSNAGIGSGSTVTGASIGTSPAAPISQQTVELAKATMAVTRMLLASGEKSVDTRKSELIAKAVMAVIGTPERESIAPKAVYKNIINFLNTWKLYPAPDSTLALDMISDFYLCIGSEAKFVVKSEEQGRRGSE